MNSHLKILFVSAECAPFSKTGGLGDVAGALPGFIRKQGHEIMVVTPMYSFIDSTKFNIETALPEMNTVMATGTINCSVKTTSLPGDVPVFFIEYEPYFGRPNIYHDNYFNDYPDNPRRFNYLSEAALQLCHELKFKPNIVHVNDWHTAVLPALLKRSYREDPFFKQCASVLTIHNIAYQGRYNRYYYDLTGLGEEDFTSDIFECYHDVNFLKGGIYYADMVNTVSNGYATETRTDLGGFGLDTYLKRKGEDYIGILNGADYSHWNPESDKLIPANYSNYDLEGKSGCKNSLQKTLGLKESHTVAVIGIVSRLVEQKGLYILKDCIDGILDNMNVQFAILGSGDLQLENFFRDLPGRYSGRVGSFIGYNNELAHLIEAGSDLFLMPSLSEPCGLNQIYSMKYGTLPVVRATGGLNDTVANYDQDTGIGTGFKFWEPSGKALYNTVYWALETYYNRKTHFQNLIQNAMRENFSWEKSAKEYISMYHKAIKNINT